jgi:hypothetical protein
MSKRGCHQYHLIHFHHRVPQCILLPSLGGPISLLLSMGECTMGSWFEDVDRALSVVLIKSIRGEGVSSLKLGYKDEE